MQPKEKEHWLDFEQKGSISLGGKVRVTDPCYDIDTWCAETVENVLPGEWNCGLQRVVFDEEWNGRPIKDERIASIEICHKDYADKAVANERVLADIGVDSGQCGFFDQKMFEEVCADEKKSEAFYDAVCDLTDRPGSMLVKNEYRFSFKDYLHLFQFEKPNGVKTQTYRICHVIEEKLGDDGIFEEAITDKESARLFEIYDKLDKDLHKDGNSLSDDEVVTLAFLKLYFTEESLYKNQMTRIPDANTYENSGFVSSSGFGDGSYDLYVGRNEDGKVVAMKLVFIYDERELQKSEEEMEEDCRE